MSHDDPIYNDIPLLNTILIECTRGFISILYVHVPRITQSLYTHRFDVLNFVIKFQTGLLQNVASILSLFSVYTIVKCTIRTTICVFYHQSLNDTHEYIVNLQRRLSSNKGLTI